MPKQEFGYQDWLGVVAVWCSFFLIIGFITVTCVNLLCIHQHDDVTALEKWGRRKNLGMRLGVHKREFVDQQMLNDRFKNENLKK